jgi:hypothetical protein
MRTLLQVLLLKRSHNRVYIMQLTGITGAKGKVFYDVLAGPSLLRNQRPPAANSAKHCEIADYDTKPKVRSMS